jgi:hypothetical protein
MKKIRLSDINWVYSIDTPTVIPIIINHEETRFWNLKTNIIHEIIPTHKTLDKVVEQIFKIDNAHISSTEDMLYDFQSSLGIITSSTIRNIAFGTETIPDYCKNHKVNNLEISALTKIFTHSVRKAHNKLKREEIDKQEEDVKSF